MMRKPKKDLVIDASIARAAGTENATHPTSVHCRDFLESVYLHGFGAVMTSEIYEEWRKHASRSSHKWLRLMLGKRCVMHVDVVKNNTLRDKIQSTSEIKKHQEIMEKDCRLLEAALASDEIVFSLDEIIRNHFRRAAGSVREIGHVHWANPDLPADTVVAWLENGAPNDKNRQLGYAGA